MKYQFRVTKVLTRFPILTPTDEYTVVPETEAYRHIIKRAAEELAKQLDDEIAQHLRSLR